MISDASIRPRTLPGSEPCAFGLIGLLLFMLAPRMVRAETSDAIVVRAEGSLSCSSAEDFWGRVRARAPGARQAHAGEPARTFIIGVDASVSPLRGYLRVVYPDGRSSARDVEGESCAEIVDALALITALDVDPDAEKVTAVAPAPVGPPPPSPDARQPWATVPALAPQGSWHVLAGAHVNLTGVIASMVLTGIPVHLELLRASPALLSPSLAIGFERSFTATLNGEQADADFVLIRGFVLACPIAWTSGPARASPCVRVEAGALEGKGRNVVQPASDGGPWWALDLSGRATLKLWGPFLVDAQLGFGASLLRYDFQLDPNIPLGQVRPWTWRATMGLQAQFL
ncbi:MAG TPA: hypothetical protein VK540_03810 [Polyangiaceae bacterium]|nr:hypothetical protein [Polyangiaceae bacterium]